jgi:hypothetical protein
VDSCNVGFEFHKSLLLFGLMAFPFIGQLILKVTNLLLKLQHAALILLHSQLFMF